MFKNLSLEDLGVSGRQSERIELTLSHGFRGFNLDLVEFQTQVERHGLAHARRLIDSARLKLGSFRLPVEWQQDEETFQRDLAKLPQLAEIAAGVGCLRSRTTIEPAGDIRPYHENFELCRRRCGEMAGVLAPHGILLGLDFVGPAFYRRDRAFQFIHSFEAALALARSISAENLGVALDVWQWHISGGRLEQIQGLSADEVVAVDLSDATTPAGDDEVEESTRVLPGENGTIDALAILSALSAAGYEGPVTPKPHPSRFIDMTREAIVRATSQALDKVWQSAGLNRQGRLGVGT